MLRHIDIYLILQLSKPQVLPAAPTASETVGTWMKFTISKQVITLRIYILYFSPFKKTILIPFLIIKRAG